MSLYGWSLLSTRNSHRSYCPTAAKARLHFHPLAACITCHHGSSRRTAAPPDFLAVKGCGLHLVVHLLSPHVVLGSGLYCILTDRLGKEISQALTILSRHKLDMPGIHYSYEGQNIFSKRALGVKRKVGSACQKFRPLPHLQFGEGTTDIPTAHHHHRGQHI